MGSTRVQAGRWAPGVSGNPAGTKPGTKRRLTPEVRSLCQKLFDREYWLLKYQRLHDGSENPKIEALLLGYAFGPVEKQRDTPEVGVVVHTGLLNLPEEQPEGRGLGLVRLMGEGAEAANISSEDRDKG